MACASRLAVVSGSMSPPEILPASGERVGAWARGGGQSAAGCEDDRQGGGKGRTKRGKVVDAVQVARERGLARDDADRATAAGGEGGVSDFRRQEEGWEEGKRGGDGQERDPPSGHLAHDLERVVPVRVAPRETISVLPIASEREGEPSAVCARKRRRQKGGRAWGGRGRRTSPIPCGGASAHRTTIFAALGRQSSASVAWSAAVTASGPSPPPEAYLRFRRRARGRGG